MPPPFQRLTVDEFADMLNLFPFTRQITNVDMHHTYLPDHKIFYSRDPVESIQAMWRVHTQVNGWKDIAQHVTIDPDGNIWTGRDWNWPPASSTGFNGTDHSGPFMFEMIGDFDLGGDPFKDPQRSAAIAVAALVQKRFSLASETLRFHSQMSAKTCPGTQIDYKTTVDEVRNYSSGSRDAVFPAESLESRTTVRRIVDGRGAGARGPVTEEGELVETNMSILSRAILKGDNAGVSRALGPQARSTTPTFTTAELASLRPYVIDLKLGTFSQDGIFSNTQADVDAIFGEQLPQALAAQKAKGQKLQLLFYAHGGLVDEATGLSGALDHLDFFVRNGIYPIFFVWQTGLAETVDDIVSGLFGSRSIVTTAANAIIAAAARPGGKAVWSEMKRIAQLASLPTGGALYVAQKTQEFWNQHSADMQIHAAGHSAGSIFHSYFLPTLVKQPSKPIVSTMHFLAPAETTALFEQTLQPIIGAGKPIERMTMYTMHKDLEQADTAGPYKGSLLYLVSNAFEDAVPTPILGLEDSIRQDVSLIRFFGLAGAQGPTGDLLFSQTPVGGSPSHATRATSHGGTNGFSNDPATMGTMVRRITNTPDGTPIFEFQQPGSTGRNLFDPQPSAAPPSPPPPPSAVVVNPAVNFNIGAAASKRALCIGINQYPDPNALSGCVNDANNWSTVLKSFGFDVTVLLDQDATHDGILAAIRALLASSSSGGIAVVQYSGHGTQVDDPSNVEKGGMDDAICPIDFASGALIIDTDLRQVFNNTPAGVNVTCFMDCCHSGTNTRLVSGVNPANVSAVGQLKKRYIPFSDTLNAAHLAYRKANASRALAPAMPGPANMKQIAFAACQDREVAFEDKGAGLFTTNATGALQQPWQGLTNQQFLAKVLASFGASPQQTPMLDCAPASQTRLFLSPLP